MWRSRSSRRPAIKITVGALAMALALAGCGSQSRSPSRTAASAHPRMIATTPPPTVVPRTPVPSTPGPPPDDIGPAAVSFVSADQGWALADVGCAGCAQVFRTTDGGRHWTSVARPVLPGSPDDFHDMYFADTEDGYIFTGDQCSGSCVLMTRDGGRTWESTSLPSVAQLIAGGDHVYALSQSIPPVLLRSTMGSDRWTPLRLPRGASSALFIAAEGPTVALLRSAQPELAPAPPPRGQLWVSTDSGNSWAARPIPCTAADGVAALVSVALDHPNALLLDCYDGKQSQQAQATQHHLYGSADTGQSWVRLADPSDTGWPELMADNGAEHAVFVSAGGFGFEVHVTLDGAAHWHTVITGGCCGFGTADLRFVSADVGFVLGPVGDPPEHLYRTEDAGRSWQEIPLPSTRPQSPASPPPCRAGSLRIHGGRQGVEEGAHGDVELVNVGSTACVLDGAPQISLIRANGTALSVRQQAATNAALHSRMLTAHGGSAWLTLFWSNWCGARPRPLSIALRLPGSGGTAQGPFDGPPDYDLVPACVASGQPSTLQVTDAYG